MKIVKAATVFDARQVAIGEVSTMIATRIRLMDRQYQRQAKYLGFEIASAGEITCIARDMMDAMREQKELQQELTNIHSRI